MLTNNRGLRVAKTSQNEKQEKKRKGKEKSLQFWNIPKPDSPVHHCASSRQKNVQTKPPTEI